MHPENTFSWHVSPERISCTLSLNTTNKYATIDLDLKRQALAQAHSPATESLANWRHDATILEWLEAL